MKKITNLILLMLLMVTPATSFAQKTAAAKARVAETRKWYAEVQAGKEYRKQAEIPADEMVITNEYMAAGAGPVKETYCYRYSGDYDENYGGQLYTLHFLTYKHNVGGRNYYTEVLYDKVGDLMFYFEKTDDGEVRYYVDMGTVVHKDVRGNQEWLGYGSDENLVKRFAADMVTAFGYLMNRSY